MHIEDEELVVVAVIDEFLVFVYRWSDDRSRMSRTRNSGAREADFMRAARIRIGNVDLCPG